MGELNTVIKHIGCEWQKAKKPAEIKAEEGKKGKLLEKNRHGRMKKPDGTKKKNEG